MRKRGERRSIGNANKVAKKVLAQPQLCAELFACLSHSNWQNQRGIEHENNVVYKCHTSAKLGIYERIKTFK